MSEVWGASPTARCPTRSSLDTHAPILDIDEPNCQGSQLATSQGESNAPEDQGADCVAAVYVP